ncbi:extracellular solute-binding protein [Candidatus Uhrbacteria bacterium]|nr:MAG: extracellular solute-binding protein [Candidatus Uhrbacteria bacterium]
MRRFFQRFLSVAALLALAGQGCTRALPAETVAASRPVTLRIWSVVDDFDVYQSAINAFRREHPNVSFDFRRLRLEEYEAELLDALAEDRGPDIFMIHNTWTNKYLTKITPMPRQTATAYRTLTEGLKKEPTWELRTEPTISLTQFRDTFADAVSRDLLRTVNLAAEGQPPSFQERPMGVPVSVDTLALYYNKDLLNAAGIPTPPENWSQFADQVKRLTRLDSQGTILQSGAAIGTAYNVERSTDILTALMLQNGAEMTTADGVPSFHVMPAALRGLREEPPSYQAVTFYTDFANPQRDVYTWNPNFPNSMDAFIQGRTAFFFGYSYHYDTIRARGPRLNLGISKLPQIEGNPVKNVANYWYWAVSRKSRNQDVAWRFLNSLTNADVAQGILTASRRPAARKSLLSAQLEDEQVGVFASQVLTAVSWYRGQDPEAMEAALQQLIEDVRLGTRDVQRAVIFAANQVAQTY